MWGKGTGRLPGGERVKTLSAWELLEARREAETLSRDGRERALCGNACLLARALRKGRGPAFSGGLEVLRSMSSADIERLAGEWQQWSRNRGPSPRDGEKAVLLRKKVCSIRRMSAFTGVCCGNSRRFPLKSGRET